MPQRPDDPTVLDEERLLRRIIPDHAVRDETSGKLRVSSAAFRIRGARELSVNLESKMLDDGRPVTEMLNGHPNCGVASITAGVARSQNHSVARDPKVEEPAHALVCGSFSDSAVKAFKKAATWIVEMPSPDRTPG